MGTPLQAFVRAAQPCLPSSSLVLLPQHRGTRGPSLAGSSQARTTVTLRLRARQHSSPPPLRSSSLRARAPTSASTLLTLGSGSMVQELATTQRAARRDAAFTLLPAASECRRLRRRLRRTFPPGSEPLPEAVMMSQAAPPPQG